MKAILVKKKSVGFDRYILVPVSLVLLLLPFLIRLLMRYTMHGHAVVYHFMQTLCLMILSSGGAGSSCFCHLQESKQQQKQQQRGQKTSES